MPSPLSRIGTLAAVALVVGGLSACTSSDPEPTASTSVTASPSPTPTPTPTVDDEAAVLDAYQRYWDAQVAAQRGNPDPALFEGIAEGSLVESALAVAREFEANGIVRDGEPSFSSQTVTIDGDSATVVACVDNSTWTVPGQTVAEGISLVQPGGLTFTRSGDSWVATASFVPPAELTC